MEHLFMAFQQAMDFDAAGTPRLGRVASYREETAEREATMTKTAPKTKSTKASVSSEEPLSVGTLEEDGILPLFSPDQQALPTRTINWSGRESFSSINEGLHFFPAEDSSDHGDESDDSDDSDNSDSSETSDVTSVFKSSIFYSGSDTSGTGGNCHGETLVSPRGSAGLLAMSTGPASPRQVLLQPKAHEALVERTPTRVIGKIAMVIIGTVATLLLGMCVGVNDLHAVSVRAPATVVTVHGQSNVGTAAESGAPVEALISIVDGRPSGRTAAQASIAAVNKLKSRYSETPRTRCAALKSATIADISPVPTEPEEQGHVTRSKNVRVQRGWVALAAAAVEKKGEGEEEKKEEATIRAGLDGRSFVDIPVFRAAELGHLCPDDCLSQSRDRLARKHNEFISALLAGPWI